MRAVRIAILTVTLWPIGLMAVFAGLGLALHVTHHCRHYDKRITYAESWRDAEPQVLPERPEPSAQVAPHRPHGSVRQAYPAWAAEHPGKECPDTLSELAPYIELSESLELWRYQVAKECGLPAPRDDLEPQ